MTTAAGFHWTSAGATDIGKVRKVNQDAFVDCAHNGLWVVADGMGGHEAGEFASQAIVDALKTITPPERMGRFVEDVKGSLQKVNRFLIEQAASRGRGTTIGSTVVVLLALEFQCCCLWAGDSRAYRLRNGDLQSISRDHSLVEEMIEQGLLRSEDARMHPAANVLTRAVGVTQELVVEVRFETLQDGDRYLLCSDGLYREASEPEIHALLQQGSCREVCERLLRLALERGARDNVTVVVIEFHSE